MDLERIIEGIHCLLNGLVDRATGILGSRFDFLAAVLLARDAKVRGARVVQVMDTPVVLAKNGTEAAMLVHVRAELPGQTYSGGLYLAGNAAGATRATAPIRLLGDGSATVSLGPNESLWGAYEDAFTKGLPARVVVVEAPVLSQLAHIRAWAEG